MSAARQPRPKICGICQEDCSSRPRTKDSDGQYFCQACCDRAKDENAGRRGPPVSEPVTPRTAPSLSPADDGLDALAEAAADASAAAPVKVARAVHETSMHPPISPAVRLPAHTEREYGRRSSRQMPQFLGEPWFAFALPIIILGILFSLGNDDRRIAVFALLLQSVFQLGVSVVILVHAFKTSVGTGLLTLCLPFYVLYFVFSAQESAHLKAVTLASMVSYLLALIMGVSLASAFPGPNGMAP